MLTTIISPNDTLTPSEKNAERKEKLEQKIQQILAKIPKSSIFKTGHSVIVQLTPRGLNFYKKNETPLAKKQHQEKVHIHPDETYNGADYLEFGNDLYFNEANEDAIEFSQDDFKDEELPRFYYFTPSNRDNHSGLNISLTPRKLRLVEGNINILDYDIRDDSISVIRADDEISETAGKIDFSTEAFRRFLSVNAELNPSKPEYFQFQEPEPASPASPALDSSPASPALDSSPASPASTASSVVLNASIIFNTSFNIFETLYEKYGDKPESRRDIFQIITPIKEFDYKEHGDQKSPTKISSFKSYSELGIQDQIKNKLFESAKEVFGNEGKVQDKNFFKKLAIYVLIAKLNQGISGSQLKLFRTELIIEELKKDYPDLSIDFNEARKFSCIFQKKLKQENILTGNINGRNMVGMRLKRIPYQILLNILDENNPANLQIPSNIQSPSPNPKEANASLLNEDNVSLLNTLKLKINGKIDTLAYRVVFM